MTPSELHQLPYSGSIEAAEKPFVRILSAENDVVFEFRLMTREDVRRFIGFLNENRVEHAHVKDCFDDFLYDFYGGAR